MGDSEPAEGRRDLPIFPLSSVLMPGMPLELKIFEDRYKIMLADCERESEHFGINLIESGVEAHGEAQPVKEGTRALVRERRAGKDGATLLTVVGGARFRILELTQRRPYLRAAVVPLEDAVSVASSDLEARSARLVERAKVLLELLPASEVGDPPQRLDAFTWYVAGRLPIDEESRHRLLQTTSLDERIELLLKMMDAVLPALTERQRVMERARTLARTNGKLASHHPKSG